ncbi:MAG: hypothetical protein ACYCWE_10555 [Eubacteriales bacterium]
MSRYSESFKNPDRRYAIYPIIHGGMASERNIAEHYEKLGFAGVVGNVPYGRGFPDDKEEWAKSEKGFRSFAERGMHTWIYDEKGYPSGTAGAVVTERHPEYIAQGLYCYDYWRPIDGPGFYRADTPDTKLYKALLLPIEGGEAVDVTQYQHENGTLYIDVPAGRYYLFMMSIRRLFDGTHATESYSEPRNYISLSDKDAAKEFISVTHKKYAEVLEDEFGKSIFAFFTDEPSLISWYIRGGTFPLLPWLHSYPEDFENKYGYPFYRACVAAVTDLCPQNKKRRCDFWEFIGDTVADGFFGIIQDWCHAHNIKSSGHLLEEERLQAHVYNYGSLMKSAKRLDWPGIDQLNSEPKDLMNPHCIPIARLLASIADFNGERETFTEFSDHTSQMRGSQIGIECIFASINWHIALGINNFTSYYNFGPFSDDDLRTLNTYAARVGYLERIGKRDSRIALFYPEASMWATYKVNTNIRQIDNSPEIRRLEQIFYACSWGLLALQCDYEYIDAEILESGVISNNKLRYKDRAYECIVMPGVTWLAESSAKRVNELLTAGISVIFAGDIPKYSRDTGLDAGFDKMFAGFEGKPNLSFAAFEENRINLDLPALPRPVKIKSDGTAYLPAILTHARITEDGIKEVFAANMGSEDFTGCLTVEGYDNNANVASPLDGEIIPAEKDGDGVLVFLKPYEGKFYIYGE